MRVTGKLRIVFRDLFRALQRERVYKEFLKRLRKKNRILKSFFLLPFLQYRVTNSIVYNYHTVNQKITSKKTLNPNFSDLISTINRTFPLMNIYVINMIYERDMQRSGRNADRTRGRRRVNYMALLISTLANLVGRLRPRPKPWISFSVPWLSLPFSQFLSLCLSRLSRAKERPDPSFFRGNTHYTRVEGSFIDRRDVRKSEKERGRHFLG